MKNLTQVFALIMTLNLLSTSTLMAANEPPPANVRMAEAVEQNLSPMMTIPGTVVSRNDGKIAAEVTGRLLYVAEVGTRVEKGEVIAELDAEPLTLLRQENIANIKRLEASLKYKEQHVVRLEQLSKTNNAAVNQFDQAISQRDMAAQDLARAKLSLRKSEYDLARTKIRAPFPGQVVERFQQAGEFSNTGRQVLRLVDTTHVEVSALAPVKLATNLVENSSVKVVGQNQEFDAYIRSVVTVGDEQSRNIEVRIALPTGRWIVGAPVRVNLPEEAARKVVTVPRDALILRQEQVYLYKVDNDNKATRVDVKMGKGHGSLIEVIGDVVSGDRVVIRGGERLRDGQSVQEINTKS